MADRLNNVDIHSSATPLYGWGLSFDLSGKGYEVAKRTWETYEAAFAYADDKNDSAAPGNILSVVGDTADRNGVYLVQSVNGYTLGKKNAADTYLSVIEDTNSTTVLTKLGSSADIEALKTTLNNLTAVVNDCVKNVKVGNKTLEKDENGVVTISASDFGLANIMHFKGVVTEFPAENNVDGDVVLKGSKEYVYSSGTWVELGDEGSYALKTVNITPGGGLSGGGNLQSDVTISLAEVRVTTTTGTDVSLSETPTTVVSGITTDEYGRVTGVSLVPVKGSKVEVAKVTEAAEGKAADAKSFKDYIDTQIGAVSGNIPATTVSAGDYITVTSDASGVNTSYTVGATVAGSITTVTAKGSLVDAYDVKQALSWTEI